MYFHLIADMRFGLTAGIDCFSSLCVEELDGAIFLKTVLKRSCELLRSESPEGKGFNDSGEVLMNGRAGYLWWMTKNKNTVTCRVNGFFVTNRFRF